MEVAFLKEDAYLMYLRKSRADNPKESVEEVLAKHENDLQEYAVRELGGRIPEHCIFREIVSGETIDEREKMCEIMMRIEDPKVKGVLVVDPQRLSRGDLEDCGKVINAFRYTKTNVHTPSMVYDLSNKMERKFLEQDLMRGNDYLEYTKEILLRGRIASIKKGSYIGNIAPFGYDKCEDDIGPTLKPNAYADAVRLVFEMYVNEGKNPLQIGRHLDSLAIKPMRGDIWEKSSISRILRNAHYAGWVFFGEHKTEKIYVNGELIKKRNMPADKDEMIIAKGRHPAIVSQKLFDAAQEIRSNNPRAKWDAPLQNPLSGLMFCSRCGKALARHEYSHAKPRYECRNRAGCGAKSVKMDDLHEALIFALENVHLPDLEVKLQSNAGNSLIIQQNQIKALQAELEKLIEQEDNQFELLETKVYTQERFEIQNKKLHAKMDNIKSKIYELKKSLPKEVDYGEKIIRLKDAIAALRDDSISAEAKNKVLKTIIKRIVYEYVAWEGKGKIRYILHIELLI